METFKIFISILATFVFTTSVLSAEVFFYDTDNVGTPVAMWNTKSNKAWEAEYYPFGQEYRSQNIKTSNKNRFIGKERDKETGLTYFGARYFDERSGRFLTPDPVRVVDPFTSKTNHELLANPQRLNRYTYGLNNPYKFVDPDGRNPRKTPRVGPNGRPIPRQLQNSDAMARTGIRVQQSQDPNYNYQSIGQNNGGYLTQRDLRIITSREVRRQVMRDAGIPTSRQPVSQISTRVPGSNQFGGRQYNYEIPQSGGGTRRYSVQHSLTDRVEGHRHHWEAGPVKPRGQIDPLGRPRLQGNKAKREE